MSAGILQKINKERTLSSIIIVICSFASIIPGGIILAAVLWLISIIGFFELAKACKVREQAGISALEITGVLAITVYYLVVYFTRNIEYMMIVMLLALIATMFVYVFGFPRFHANQVMATYFSIIYCPIMLSYIYLTRQLDNGIYFVWMIFISSWISDTCAYAVGILVGRHKLAPLLSPKKSIEGSIGGIAGAAIVGALFGSYLDKVFGISDCELLLAIVGGVGSIISQVGDLAASAIKRNHDIKDYGKLIPGHGGIMDRFDSVIFTAPITYFLIILLMK